MAVSSFSVEVGGIKFGLFWVVSSFSGEVGVIKFEFWFGVLIFN